MTKELRLSFNDSEFKRIKEIKEKLNLTWKKAVKQGFSLLKQEKVYEPIPEPENKEKISGGY
jgi:hypothetical protein